MRERLMVAATALFVLATMGPPAQAGDAFWHGGDIRDTGPHGLMDNNEHKVLHDYLISLMPTLFENGGFNRLPSGDKILDGDYGVRIHNPYKVWSGFTLLNSFPKTGTAQNASVVLIDMKGNIVNEWPAMGTTTKILPGGHVVGTSPGSGFVQLDWSGKVVNTWPNLDVHHDHEREGNPCGYWAPYQKPRTLGGKVLALEYVYPILDQTKHICDKAPLQDDMIREVSWTGEVLFTWKAWEHLDELGLDEAARNALQLGIAPGRPASVQDWAHANAVSWLGPNKWWSQHYDGRFHPANILVDFRRQNSTIIIARYDDPYGKWKSGDVIWRLGPNYSTAGDDGQVGQIIGQHMAHLIPMYMPGEGNLLMFDNGGGAGFGALLQGLEDPDNGEKLGFYPNKYRHFTRVLEINPLTKQIVWQYKQPWPTKDQNNDGKKRGNERLLFSGIMGGAQRLMNGNTLITEAETGRIIEVTKHKEVVWEYVAPWQTPQTGLRGVAVYRAYRVPYWWVPTHLLNKGP